MNMRLLWCTDLHLNFLSIQAIREFGQRIAAAKPDAVVISGDIAEHTTFDVLLEALDDQYDCNTFFVLGNHDFYGARRSATLQKAKKVKFAHWLTGDEGYVELTPQIALIGHDGWYDGRNGCYDGCTDLTDNYAILDLKWADKWQKLELFQKWTDEAADNLRTRLIKALDAGYAEVYCITHVPPMHEAGWHEGQLNNDQWAPVMSNAVVGPNLVTVMEKRPEQHLTILTGHTHSPGYHRASFNVEVHTGASAYGHPRFEIIELGDDSEDLDTEE
jgi:predicted phosphodiesterase